MLAVVAFAAAVGTVATAPATEAAQAGAAPSPACLAGAESAASVAPLLLEVLVNGAEHEVIAVRYVAPGGPLYLPESVLQQWGLRREKLGLQSIGSARWLCVEGLGIPYRLDPAALTLALDFPLELYEGFSDALVASDRLPVSYAPGGFFNYDLRADRSDGVGSRAVNWEIGAFAGMGLLSSSFFSGDKGRGTIRLDTSLRRDDPERITSAVLGDTITNPGSYGAAVRMAGLQYQRNFGNAPLLITYPSADVSGTAVVPSAVDVYIGNALSYTAQLKPGPFSVANLPVPVGAGNVRVVVRDMFGKESTVVVPYVRYDSMLKEGLHDFSYEVGRLRRDYGVKSNDYGAWAAVGTHRYGVNDQLTLEGHAEGMADRANLGGLVQVTMPVLGLVGIGGAASSWLGSSGPGGSGLGKGQLGKAFFQRTERTWSAGAAVEKRSQNYVDIAYEPGQIRTLSTAQVSASARVGELHWLNVLGLRTSDQTGSFNTATLGWTVSLPRSATLSANVSRFWGSQPTTHVATLMLTMPLGERDFFTASAERRSDALKPDLLLNASRNLLETDSIGYRIVAGEQSEARRLELGAFAQTGVGQFGIEAAEAFGSRAARAYARGGIAAVDGEWRVSRYIDQSFAIVKVADFPDVRVFANSQPVGKTDAHGIAVIPRLSGFMPSRISFEAEDIPLDGSFAENGKPIKVANRMGVLLDMGVLRRLSATLTLVEANGQAVPAGAVARVGEAQEEFPVGRRGRVYLSGLERGKPNPLRVQIGERNCRALVELPEDFSSGTTLGVFTCQ